MKMSFLRPVACAAGLVVLASVTASAQTKPPVQQQVVKPPESQLWMDVATVTMAGMSEADMGMDMGMGMSMPMPGVGKMFGGGSTQGNAHFGKTRGMMPGRFVDIAFVTQRKPAGTEATQTVPKGTGLAPSLLLLPYKTPAAAKSAPSRRDESDEEPPAEYEQPKGRILFYWGCGETVRPGQPRVIDFSKSPPTEWGKFMQGRAPRERGAVARPGRSLWPNDRDHRRFGRDASLVGDHALSGEGVPASLRFALASAQTFMAPLKLRQSGSLEEVLKLSWPAVPTATGYFMNAMSGGDDEGGFEMVMWSSAEVPEFGMGLIDYASPANIERWQRDKVLLPSSATQCAIPRGIFAKHEGPMLRMVAYGSELNLAYPERPTDIKIPWEPEWAVRVRNKSTTMATLGEDMDEGGDDSGSASADARPGCKPPEEEGGAAGVGGILGGGLGRAVGGALGGMFGKKKDAKEPKQDTPPDCAP